MEVVIIWVNEEFFVFVFKFWFGLFVVGGFEIVWVFFIIVVVML